MDWLIDILSAEKQDTVAHIMLLYSIVVALGIYLGKIKIGGISFSVTFVLFMGIFVGHIRFTGPIPVLTFVQDFGLILLVFMIGLQVGPGSSESFGRGGLELNILSTVAILLNVLVMFACYYIFSDTQDKTNLPMMVGTFYDAATNTPDFGAANEALHSVFGSGMDFDIAFGYACAYPLGVVGIISATIAIRYICKVDLQEENEKLNEEEAENPHAKPYTMYLKVQNACTAGRKLEEISEFLNRDFVCTRFMHEGVLSVPTLNNVFELGDEILVVSAEGGAATIRALIGPEIEVDWYEEDQPQQLVSRRIVITSSKINGKILSGMHFRSVHGVNVTRTSRQGMGLFAGRNHRFIVDDRIMVVGPEESVNRVASMMGNSEKRLDAPDIATIFVDIIVGIISGTLPIAIPHMPIPVKLGLAGGPLVIAVLIGRFGYRMGLVTYTTTSANMMLRGVGLTPFLAFVGIKAGATFQDTVIQGDGLKYVYTGFIITIVPILIVGTIACLKYKFNYFTIMGMLAGTYTDPPALAYANSTCTGEVLAVGYSIVYPLSIFLRIFLAQVIILFFCQIQEGAR